MQAKGYEQMSIQDVLDEMGASRGAFYHYFDVQDGAARGGRRPAWSTPRWRRSSRWWRTRRSAVAKLEGLFGGIAQWKMERTS